MRDKVGFWILHRLVQWDENWGRRITDDNMPSWYAAYMEKHNVEFEDTPGESRIKQFWMYLRGLGSDMGRAIQEAAVW